MNLGEDKLPKILNIFFNRFSQDIQQSTKDQQNSQCYQTTQINSNTIKRNNTLLNISNRTQLCLQNKSRSHSRSQSREEHTTHTSKQLNNFLVNIRQLHSEISQERNLYQNLEKYVEKSQEQLRKHKDQQPLFIKLLNETQQHDQEYEKLKLQKMKEDITHRKQLMLMRVIGLSKIAPKFKYFQDVTKQNYKSKILNSKLRDNSSQKQKPQRIQNSTGNDHVMAFKFNQPNGKEENASEQLIQRRLAFRIDIL